MTNLPTSLTTVAYSGSPVTYTAQADGVFTFKLWGAAGGPPYGQSPISGPGGFVSGSVLLASGDTIAVTVGGGGLPSSGSGAAGGYPNGGSGNGRGGGGGGRTQITRNGTVIAVAGAGGGAGDAGGGGAGGGITGGPSLSGSVAESYGASQTSGGWPPGQSSSYVTAGSAYQGGNGGSGTWAGGGGDGYFGGCGGGVNAPSNDWGGSGGSGYLEPLTIYDKVWAQGSTATNEPGGYTDPAYPGGGVGVGVGSGGGTGPTGGNGAAAIVFDTSPSYTTLPVVLTTISASGADAVYVVGATATQEFKLWGAAGGANASGAEGAAGAFVDVLLSLTAGDIVRIQVGGGGIAPSGSSTNEPGAWPDGGSGLGEGGSGGGSSRIFVNDVLQAAAGAAGGSGGSGGIIPGYGGSAAAGGPALNGSTTIITGGTASAGGYPTGTSPSYLTAGSLLMAGFPAYDSWAAGAGGGYYGGGASPDGSGDNWSAAGGSSYASGPLVTSATIQAGTATTPGGTTDPDYVSGIGAPTASGTAGTGMVVILAPVTPPTPAAPAFRPRPTPFWSWDEPDWLFGQLARPSVPSNLEKVGKITAYAVMGVDGVALVPKITAYAVLNNGDGVALVPKIVAYAVLEPAPVRRQTQVRLFVGRRAIT